MAATVSARVARTPPCTTPCSCLCRGFTLIPKTTCPISKLSSLRPSSEVAPVTLVRRRKAASYFFRSLNSSETIGSSCSSPCPMRTTSTPKARHPAEPPLPLANSIPPTPETPPFPPHLPAFPSAPAESTQFSPSAKLFPLPTPQKAPAPILSPQSRDKYNSIEHFHARGRAPSPSSAESLRPLMRNKLRDLSSPPNPTPSPHSQSPHRPPSETPPTPLYTSRTVLSN